MSDNKISDAAFNREQYGTALTVLRQKNNPGLTATAPAATAPKRAMGGSAPSFK